MYVIIFSCTCRSAISEVLVVLNSLRKDLNYSREQQEQIIWNLTQLWESTKIKESDIQEVCRVPYWRVIKRISHISAYSLLGARYNEWF